MLGRSVKIGPMAQAVTPMGTVPNISERLRMGSPVERAGKPGHLGMNMLGSLKKASFTVKALMSTPTAVNMSAIFWTINPTDAASIPTWI